MLDILENFLQEDAVLQHLDATARQKLKQNMRVIKLLPKQYIRLNGIDLYILLQGSLTVGELKANGQWQVYHQLQQPKLFNVVACVQKKSLDYEYLSQKAGTLLQISGRFFLQCLQDYPLMAQAVLKLVSYRMWQNFQQQRYIQNHDLKQVIAYYLLQLSHQQTELSNSIHMSQQAFADLLHISRQTLHKHLGAFLKLGLIQWRYHKVIILDRVQLEQWAKGHTFANCNIN